MISHETRNLILEIFYERLLQEQNPKIRHLLFQTLEELDNTLLYKLRQTIDQDPNPEHSLRAVEILGDLALNFRSYTLNSL